MSSAFSSCVPCDMLMRTPFAPASISCSTISGSREAGPSVIRIFARLKSFSPVLFSRDLQSRFDCFVEILARSWSISGETLHELALAIEDERLGNAVVIAEQESYEIFVRLCEGVLNAKLFRELRHFFVVTWTTDVESDHDQSLVFILLLHADQMRDTVATRHAPGRVEIEYQHFPAVLGKNASFPARLPAHAGERGCFAGRRHRIGCAGRGIGNDGRVGVRNREVVAVAAR